MNHSRRLESVSSPAAAPRRPGRSTGFRRQAERGQASVELVLILPVITLLVFGLLDLGRVFSMQLALANAAREGARYCALRPGDTAGTRARIADELGRRTTADVGAVTCPLVAPRQPVTVTVRAAFVPVTPLIRTLAGRPITLAAPATMASW